MSHETLHILNNLFTHNLKFRDIINDNWCESDYFSLLFFWCCHRKLDLAPKQFLPVCGMRFLMLAKQNPIFCTVSHSLKPLFHVFDIFFLIASPEHNFIILVHLWWFQLSLVAVDNRFMKRNSVNPENMHQNYNRNIAGFFS